VEHAADEAAFGRAHAVGGIGLDESRSARVARTRTRGIGFVAGLTGRKQL
jgi:hypothetical protein